MIERKILDDLNDHFQQMALSFSKEDWTYLAGKDTPRGRMLGFLTPEYYKREKLWETGIIVWGFAFKTFMDNAVTAGDRVYPSWVLFSPVQAFCDDPTLYYAVQEKLLKALEGKPKGKAQKQLKIALEGELSEPQYMEIPVEYTEGKLVYLSMVYVRPTHFPDFHLGFVPLIINKLITAEVMYVPDRYWTDAFKAIYYK
jgi:hypothetical protein